MAISINRKILRFRWLAADLTLNVSNAPWLSNVLKVKGETVPASSGLNNETAYAGSFNGAATGGTLAKLVQNTDYTLISGVYNGWSLPTAIEVFNLGQGAVSGPPVDLAPNQTGIKITSVTTSGNDVTLVVTKTNYTGGFVATINGTDFGNLNQVAFPGQAPGSYPHIAIKAVGAALDDYWGRTVTLPSNGTTTATGTTPTGGTTTPPTTTTPPASSGTQPATTNVQVSNNTVTVTAVGDGGTKEYTVDGTNFQASNIFYGVSNGSYPSVGFRFVGTTTLYKYASTVVVNYTPAASTTRRGIVPLPSADFNAYTQDEESFYVATRNNSNPEYAFNAFLYANLMIGTTGQPGLQGRVLMQGRVGELTATVMGAAPSKLRDVNALPYALYIDDSELQVLLSGTASDLQNTQGIAKGFEIWFYDTKVEFYFIYVNQGDTTPTTVLIKTVNAAPTYPLIPTFSVDRNSAVLRKMFMVGPNLIATPTT